MKTMMLRWDRAVLVLAMILVSDQAWALETATPGFELPPNWKETATLITASVAASVSLLNYGHTLFKERGKKKADGVYLAMRMSVLLESYAEDCADAIIYNEYIESFSRSNDIHYKLSLPTVPNFPDDADGWKAIDVHIANRCLTFGNRVRGSQGMIQNAINYGVHDAENVFLGYACERGLDAYSIAKRLRRYHGLKRSELIFEYDDYLKSELTKWQSRKDRSQIKNVSKWKKFFRRIRILKV